ncbi:hypothetical protein DEO72_LG4g1407 [Vigna unguiculata]|uniref:Uncharacterized protein n=1 Tax=Vigna unguiculata TaxID=3917 RepID=A0A4D6LPK8_VIGUN|nr:hypothetical protein DEO72_LG4g1407 [Vigna unguiculata]
MSFSFFPNPLTTDVLVRSTDDPGLYPIGNWKCNDGCSSAAGAGSSTVVLLQRRSNRAELAGADAWNLGVVVLVLHLRPGFAVSWFARRRTRGGRGCKVCGGAAVAVKRAELAGADAWNLGVVVLVLHLRPGFAVSWFARRRTRGGRGCKVCGGAAGFANLELEP